MTRDYIIGLRAVTADGGLLRTGVYNESEAFALSDVLIGSEGTLAIVTEIAVRLIPTPRRGSTILVAFDTPEDAARTVAEITAEGIIPTVMEYLDGDAADCSNRYERRDGLDDVAAILLLETSAERDRDQTEKITAICRANHSSYLRRETERAQAEELWRVRRNLSKAIRDAARFRYNEDIAVPISSFAAMIAFVAELNRRGPVRINAFGHAGDGNLHVSFLSMTGDNDELRLIAEGVERLYRQAVALGGTLTGEHGIGLHKGRFLPLEFDPPTLATMRAFKDVFDPHGILNPGKVFAESG